MILTIILTLISLITWIIIIFVKDKYKLKISLCLLNIAVNILGIVIFTVLVKFIPFILSITSFTIWGYMFSYMLKLQYKDNH